MLKKHEGDIQSYEKITSRYKVVNRKIKPSFSYLDLNDLLSTIFDNQKSAFKVSIGFGFILLNPIQKEYKYYYVSTNNLLFEKAFTITNQRDLTHFMKKIMGLDLTTNYYLKRPSSGWVLAGLTNVQIRIFDIKHTLIGTSVELPHFIRNSKSICALTCDYNGNPYLDNKCFFRCLAIHQGANIWGLERVANRLKRELEDVGGEPFSNGVDINDLPFIERFFKVSVNVYSLKEDMSCDVIYHSNLQYQPMHVNLFHNHFSYIKNFNTYAKRYQCLNCDRIFDRANSLSRHINTCNTEIKEFFHGGKYKSDNTLFERLENIGLNVTQEDRFYPYFSCYDYEALQVPRDEKILGRDICFKHIPATFSICSNIPGHTNPIHKVSNGNPQHLVDKMVKIQLQQQQIASKLMHEKFADEFFLLEEYITEVEGELEIPNDQLVQFQKARYLKKLKTLKSSLENYCNQLIILGFNSQRYDIPLIKRYLPSSLKRLDSLPSWVIKKGNAYMSISTKNLKYLDITNYLAAHTSLENFYKAFNVTTPKANFPYQYFNSLDKLHGPFPGRDYFYSILSNSSISTKDYEESKEEWILQNMETFGDYVKYYNNLDVTGMVEAVEKMLDIYMKKGLDIFKDSVSLPGITMKYIMKNLGRDYFTSIGEEHSHIYKDLRNLGVVGGPSQVIHRYHEKGETKIRGEKTCEKIMGYDCNSMYVWALGKDMPIGYYILREKKNNFKKQTRYSNEAIQWLNYMSKTTGLKIRHATNHIHGEAKIGKYSVDGFCAETNEILEYYGCHFHGHSCYNNYNPEKWAKTMERERELRKLGYKVIYITSCEWFKDPESKKWYHEEEAICTYTDIHDAIIQDEIFGFGKYNVHVPEELKEKFSEFPPIFKNTEIKLQDVGEHMQEYCRKIGRTAGVKRSLIGSMFGDGIVTLTALYKKYVEMGLKVTDIEWVQEYTPKPVFKWFEEEITLNRRMADLDENLKIQGETSKLMGNAGYGGTLIDKTKHISLKFCSEENVDNHIKNPLFKNMEELEGEIYEVEKLKKSVSLNAPIQVGIAVYSYAKLSLISFWEFLNKFLRKSCYELMACDTDSLYIALAKPTLDKCVKRKLREEWRIEKEKWFSSTDDREIDFEGFKIPFKQWDKRTPGKYKAEFEGDGMIALNSKVYHIWGRDEEGNEITKTSCKGSQKRRNQFLKENFFSVLETQLPHIVKNAGFIRDGLTIKTYTQCKVGFAYFYPKRKVQNDGVTTTHLDI